MPSFTAGHSHKSTTKSSHKPFKGGKGRHRKGKTAYERPKAPHQQVLSKTDRRNKNLQRQLEKQKEHRLAASIFNGRDGAPRNVAVIPLCAGCDAIAAVRALNSSLDIETSDAIATSGGGAFRVPVDRFKQNLQYILVPADRDVLASIDAARAADFVVFVLSATEEVDERGELILRSVESQGLSTLFTAVDGISAIESHKQRLSVMDSLKSFMRHFHPDQEKLFSLDNRQECSNLIRSLCSATPKGIHWREERSWMLVEDVQFGDADSVDGPAAIITGVVRGRGLKADRLVQVGDWGTFQIDKITAAPLDSRKHGKAAGAAADSMAVDAEGVDESVLDLPTEDREDLEQLAPEGAVLDDSADDMDDEDAENRKGVLLDDHHYFSEDENPQSKPARRLPRGTSEYQSAWILDDVTSESGSDMDDDDNDDEGDVDLEGAPTEKAEPADGMEGIAQYAPTEGGGTEYPQSEAPYVENDDEQEAAQLAMYRQQKRTDAEDDLEFPDEIELHPNVLARERLARYRGLKSLRSSHWNVKEDRPHEPEDWRRLLQIPDYRASRIRATREALVGGVAPGTRVSVHLARSAAVPAIPAAVRAAYTPTKPVTLFSLLRHENKQTVVNYLINLSADEPRSVKSKDELIVQCGPRRFVVRPLFSQSGVTPNDVHKFNRFLHAGQSAVATFVAPVTWGSVPTLFFTKAKQSTVRLLPGIAAPPALRLAGTGTSLPPSTSRVVAKRVVLTGHPYHIHKRIVTIRYMFFNREDVEWFKALPLWTKRGRSGYIKECLGTHGYFKATFDGRINPQDSVGVSLYKRVFPRNSTPYQEWASVTEAGQAQEDDEMDEDEDME